jgi:paraquat-inducible protein B
MAEPPDEPREARARPHQWIAWVWVVPSVAAIIVVWLALRSLTGRGPEITISFKVAEGLQPGQTHIQHRNVDVGTVESLQLAPDMSRVIVHARMSKAAEPYLNENTLFYIVAPRVGPGGITGLTTIVSGAYIEMYPGKAGGTEQRQFAGLDQPPVLRPDTPGRSFTLESDDLGSLTRGSQISFNGVQVGQIQDYALSEDGQMVRINAFVREPYDRLVYPETRFWNSGGVDVAIGANGVRIRATSWQELLTGGVAFETPKEALGSKPADSGSTFELFDNRRAALRAPHGDPLIYIADFTGNQRGVDKGTPVELQGNAIGEVRSTQLKFDEKRKTLVTVVTFVIDPEQVKIQNMPSVGATRRETVQTWIDQLVARGLRAQVSGVSLLTGLKILALDMQTDVPVAKVEKVDGGVYPKIPSVPSGDLTEVLASLRDVLKNVDRATAGPELGHAIKSLDRTLTNLDKLTKDAQPDLQALIKSLRDTADAAQGTLGAVQGMVGNSNETSSDLPRLMRELTDAARSVKSLADYLDRHPEALLRGRKDDDK